MQFCLGEIKGPIVVMIAWLATRAGAVGVEALSMDPADRELISKHAARSMYPLLTTFLRCRVIIPPLAPIRHTACV